MCTASTFIIVSVAVLAGAAASATERGHRETAASATSVHLTPSNGDLPPTAFSRALSNEPPLQIENVRLVAAPAEAPQPSVVLKFDVFNDTTRRLTDVVMRVSFVEKQQDDIDTASPRVVIGPVTVRVGEILRAGYVISYEMLFRNLSPECNCAPRIEVLSARLIAD